MGSFMGDAFTPSEEYTYNVIIEDMPNEYKAILDNSEYEGMKLQIKSLQRYIKDKENEMKTLKDMIRK